MTRLGRLALLLLLGGCGAEDAGQPVSPEATSRPGEARAFEIVRDAFDRGMGMQGLLEDSPRVRWSDELCPTRATDGTYKTAVFDGAGRCYSGLSFEGCDLRVAWRGSYHASAYAHEIMHCLLDRAGRPDPEHASEPSAWALVQATDEALAEAGL